ncbi:MAG TPA: hypothetical protein VET23_04870 [Chitinophagaceae bacterium]|nr:hypothetical protein [Chitinophagaceae bacterium]
MIQNVNQQKKFLHQNLQQELEIARRTNDGSLDESDFKKITAYYGLAVPAILGEALCVLRGKKMTEQERKALTYQGAMTGLFDDFFDKENLSDESVKAFMEKPEETTGKNSRLKLFLDLYKKALAYAHDPQLMLHYLKKVYDAQVESKQQAITGSLPKDEIKRITVNKGGVSVLFYRSVLSNPLNKEEEEALYQMGGLMQFGNDIFDVYKDCQKKIDTLMTTARNINDIRSEFIAMTESSFHSVYQTAYPKKNTRKFLRLISMSLCSRCYVCLDHLEKKERQTNHKFLPYQYNRAALVCDMEKPVYKWRSVLYHIRQEI